METSVSKHGMSKKTIAKYVFMGFIGFELLAMTCVFLCGVSPLPGFCKLTGPIVGSSVILIVKTAEFSVELFILYQGYAEAVIIPLIKDSSVLISTIPVVTFLLMGILGTICICVLAGFYAIVYGPILATMQLVNWINGAAPLSV